jgi:hypothetical protein
MSSTFDFVVVGGGSAGAVPRGKMLAGSSSPGTCRKCRLIRPRPADVMLLGERNAITSEVSYRSLLEQVLI